MAGCTVTDQPVFKISRELLMLAGEAGATQAMKQYVEGIFKAQFGMDLTLTDTVVSIREMEITNLHINDYTVEIIE